MVLRKEKPSLTSEKNCFVCYDFILVEMWQRLIERVCIKYQIHAKKDLAGANDLTGMEAGAFLN